ncbi:VCBS repeat-containing protein [Maribacter sp. 2304DJ31-5]|uniref:VCBS repeat-containing protein n=1 Tax=Maribacter sp. 2304DJ31-5 TaxID=3386273 RepID=UPI0039BD07B1
MKNYMIYVFFFVLCLGCKDKTEKKVAKTSVPIKKQFELVDPSESGILFKNPVPESKTMNGLSYEYYYNGGGVAIGDLNNDGLPDIFFTASVSPNKLYINKGNLKFIDATKEAQIVDTPSWTTGVAMADVNGDGLLDIYVSRSGRLSEEQRANKLFINQGTNKNNVPQFKEMAKIYGLDDSSYSTQSLFFDYDKDGDLDMFLLNHNVLTKRFDGFDRNKRTPLVGDKLYRNDNGKFVDISKNAGINGNEIGYGLGVAAGDLNNDSWPDLYVSNDYDEHDYLYINNQDGTFSERSKEQLKHLSFYSMGVDISDYDNDGNLDIFTLDMVSDDNFRLKASMSGMAPERFYKAVENGFHHQYMFNCLQRNNGNGTFSEVAHLAGIPNTDWSWSVLLNDLDNDGYKDVFITNGLKRDFRNNDFVRFKEKVLLEKEKKGIDKDSLFYTLTRFIPPRAAVNSIFKSKGDLSFDKVNTLWGITNESYSNGASLSDLDNDGDLDMVVNNVDQTAFVYKNNSNEISDNNYLKIQLKGPEGNVYGLGAKLYLEHGDELQYHEHYLTRGFQSSIDPIIHFGTGDNKVLDQLRILWPDGKQQKIKHLEANKTLVVNYADALNLDDSEYQTKENQPLLVDVTHEILINKTHVENKFNDFERESLLPHKMSETGPAFAAGDVNHDGLDDIFYGGAKGQPASLLIQQEDGTFKPWQQQFFDNEKNYEDVSALFFDADNDSDMDLYVTSGGNEYAKGSKWYYDRLYMNDGLGKFSKCVNLPQMAISSSCVKSADFDNDGDLDLFVGGRQEPGKYPFPANSILLRNESIPGTVSFVDATAEIAPDFHGMGMVTDAVWTDFNNDKFLDLVIVGEWMGIRTFENQSGSFVDVSKQNELSNEIGWWYSIVAADFDKDGDDDFIVGNLGTNYKYKSSKEKPFEIYASDFDDNKTVDVVLGYYNQNKLFPLRGRECSSNQMPFIKKKFPNYNSFAQATLVDVYGAEKLENALTYKANNFTTSYVENLGNGEFRVISLQNEAQISCVNAIHVDDFDKDGYLDALLVGNNYGVEVETIRNDASYGVLMKGDGKGGFNAYRPRNTGVTIDGVVRHVSALRWKQSENQIICFAKNNAPLQFIQPNK